MKQKKGYKEMLRDRCPKVVNYALKWQKAKEKWIEHVYTNFISIYVDKDQRNRATRIVLGIADEGKYKFDFNKTIDWDNLTPKEKSYWMRISGWVMWFCDRYAYIENAYNILKEKGKDNFEIQVEIIKDYLSWLLPNKSCTKEVQEAKYKYADDLASFLINCIEGKI